MQAVALTLSLVFWTSLSFAAPATPDITTGMKPGFIATGEITLEQFDRHASLLLAETESRKNGKDKPRSGDLVIPGEQKPESEKKCLNVCREWGEDCIINPRTGARNCRRTCKDFGMECF